jgi:hypothetical protein
MEASFFFSLQGVSSQVNSPRWNSLLSKRRTTTIEKRLLLFFLQSITLYGKVFRLMLWSAASI